MLPNKCSTSSAVCALCATFSCVIFSNICGRELEKRLQITIIIINKKLFSFFVPIKNTISNRLHDLRSGIHCSGKELVHCFSEADRSVATEKRKLLSCLYSLLIYYFILSYPSKNTIRNCLHDLLRSGIHCPS